MDSATLHVAIVLATFLLAMYAFIRETFTPDVTALLVLLVLVISGVLTPQEGFAGFSHPATISVAAVLVLSGSLERSGAFEFLARRVLSRIGRSESVFALVLMCTVGLLSAFINNTAAVAVFLPLVLETCRRTGARPGRLLLPLSYAAMFGGMSTLIGTSTNIVVHEYARSEGLAGFRMFELARVGLPLFVIGVVYLLFASRWFLRRGEPVGPAAGEGGKPCFAVDAVVDFDSSWIGKPADAVRFRRDFDVELVEVSRGHTVLRRRQPWPKLMVGDRLRLHGGIEPVMRLAERSGLQLHRANGATSEATVDDNVATTTATSEAPENVLAEIVLLPGSPAVGHSLQTARLRGAYDSHILGMRRAGHAPEEHGNGTLLRPGDALLLETTPAQLDTLKRDRGLLVMGSHQGPEHRAGRLALSVTTLVGVVAAAATGLLPIVTAASAGCLLLMVTGTLRPREAYESINWQVIFMLAGVLALGTAMQKTGIAQAIATGVAALTQSGLHPMFAVSVFYAITSILTEFMSNAASAALLVPVALHTADILGVQPEPFLVAVAVAASTSFATPVGYQTNLMVYGPGGYRFGDFVRVGLPLNLIFWVFLTFAIPLFWPL